MPPLLHPIWLLIILSALVLLIGCLAMPSRTPTQPATSNPPVTLTVYRFPADTPLPMQTITPPQMRHSPSSGTPPNARAIADPPTCYERPDGGYICLGRVQNVSGEALVDVRVDVRLAASDATILAQKSVSVAQKRLPPDTYAPYRALIDPLTHPYTITQASVQTARFAPHRSYRDLLMRDERGRLTTNGRYIITGTLQNTTAQRRTQLQAVVTLLAADDTVVGYRVHELPSLAAGETLPLRLITPPQITADAIRHTLHIDAS